MKNSGNSWCNFQSKITRFDRTTGLSELQSVQNTYIVYDYHPNKLPIITYLEYSFSVNVIVTGSVIGFSMLVFRDVSWCYEPMITMHGRHEIRETREKLDSLSPTRWCVEFEQLVLSFCLVPEEPFVKRK
jgi:hypothetical protein